MDCPICKKSKTGDMVVYSILGPVCKSCDETGYPSKVEARYKKFIKKKKLRSYPDSMSLWDFEVMVRQIAHTYLDKPEFRKQMKEVKVNPILYIPSQFALHIKESVIDLLPNSVVRTFTNSGSERWAAGGTYSFRNNQIPKSVVLEKLDMLDLPFPTIA